MNRIEKFSESIEKIDRNASSLISGGSGASTDTCKGTTESYILVTVSDSETDGDFYPDC